MMVSVGVESDQLSRWGSEMVTVGRTKTYQDLTKDYSGARCNLVIPVSFTRGVELRYQLRSENSDPCTAVQAYAKTVIAKLQNPDAVAVDNVKRPFSAWDGCFFLEQPLGPDTQKYRLAQGDPDYLSSCLAIDKDPRGTSGPTLNVRYDLWQPSSGQQRRQIGGKDATVEPGNKACGVAWNQGDSQTGNKYFLAQVFKIYAANCDIATQYAEKAISLATQSPSNAATQPQRPLLFKADEDDTGSVGACLDLPGNQEDCEPYHEVQLPQASDQIMAAAEKNRNVQCAVFQDAVQANYGPTFKPITWAAHCFLVDPSHLFDITVDVDPKNRSEEYGKGGLYTERQETQIAGKPAVTFYTADKTEYDVYLSPSGSLADQGNLHINARGHANRGTGSAIHPQVDQGNLKLADQVMAQVVQKYFP
jgi:hypothetical protein